MAYNVRWNHGQDDSSGLLDQARIIASQWMGLQSSQWSQQSDNLYQHHHIGIRMVPIFPHSTRLILYDLVLVCPVLL